MIGTVALHEKLDDLTAHIASLKAEVRVEHASEPMEELILTNVREAVAAELRRLVANRDQVLDAIHRIKSGTWGICSQCHGSISDKRLVAMPETELCFGCATQNEMEKTNEE